MYKTNEDHFLQRFSFLFIIIALLIAPIQAFAEQTSKGWEAFQLDNGLQVVVIPQRRVPIVTHLIAYKVGAADEPEGLSGMAHFFEHLMFKATKTRASGELDSFVNSVGGEHNAFTNSDSTVYYQQVPPEALEQIMSFEADRMRNLILDDATIETERQVVLEERLMRVDNEPSGILREAINAALYLNHPYKRPIIGWRHEIEALTREQLTDFYNHYYEPNNAVVVVAGDVDAETVRRLAEATYGQVPAGPALPPRKRPMEPDVKAMRMVELKDDRITIPSMRQVWVVPAYLSEKGSVSDALYVLSDILAGGQRSRLYKKLVVQERLATNVNAYLMDSMDYGEFSINADPISPDTLKQVESAIQSELEKISSEGVTEEELAVAKKVYASSLVFSRERQMSRALDYASQLVEGGSLDELDDALKRVELVTVDSIKHAAKQYLQPGLSVKAYLLPETETN